MEVNKVAFKWKLQYLVVIFDVHVSWMPHLNAVLEKGVQGVRGNETSLRSQMGTKAEDLQNALFSSCRAKYLICGLSLVL